MAFDDLPLDHATPGRSAPSPPPASPTRWVIVAAAAIIAGAALTFWWMNRAQLNPAPPTPISATDVAIGANRPKRQPINLPSLDGSDALLRELVSALSKHPTLARFLVTDGLVRAGVLAVVQAGDGRTPAVPLKVLRPVTRLDILGTTSGPIDPKSYARWDSAVSALTSVTPSDAAQVYVNIKPLSDQAYRELGLGDDFDEALSRALRMLADTPEVTTDPLLLRRPNYFEHDDATLRALRPVQKQLLLLGPENRRRTIAWLRQFAAALDLKF